MGNARQASAYYRALWGFTPVAFSGSETKVRDRASYVMVQNDIRFVFTAPLTPDGETLNTGREHGDGVHDIAFRVADVESSWRETTSRGAASALKPTEIDARRGRRAAQGLDPTYGETLHSFVDRGSYHGAFAPGYRKVKSAARAADGLSLLEVDHCVGNVELGQMDAFVDFYRDVLGFAQLIHYDDKVIHTDYSALMSKVMTNGNGRIKFPINEPATARRRARSRNTSTGIDRPVASTSPCGPRTSSGRCAGCGRTVSNSWGCRTSTTATLADRVGDVGVPMDTLEELGIEADRDEEGYFLLRIFTRPVRSPDVLLRDHRAPRVARLRVGNFKALFEAIEREQEKRGNL